MITWFISDTHLGHANIVTFENTMRAALFDTIEEHDEAIMDLWNDRVKKRDVVYHLGDVAANKWALAKVKKLPGIKQLVLGNHDKLSLKAYLEVFNNVMAFKEWDNILLTHFPIDLCSVRPRYRGNFHGHLHDAGIMPVSEFHVCICPDVIGTMGPVSIDEFIQDMRGFGPRYVKGETKCR